MFLSVRFSDLTRQEGAEGSTIEKARKQDTDVPRAMEQDTMRPAGFAGCGNSFEGTRLGQFRGTQSCKASMKHAEAC